MHKQVWGQGNVISPSQHRQNEILPMPCLVAAVISFQLSTSNPATDRECRTLRLGTSSCPSLPAHPGHNWTFLQPGHTFASTGHCSVASWAYLPGCKYWVSSLGYLAKTTFTGLPGFETAIAYLVFQGLSATVLVFACYWACFHQEEPESFPHCTVGDSMQMASPW